MLSKSLRSGTITKQTRSIAVLLALALLGSQLVAIQHNHDDNLSHHFYCSICVKQSIESDYLLSDIMLPVIVIAAAVSVFSSTVVMSRTPLAANSRAPPLA